MKKFLIVLFSILSVFSAHGQSFTQGTRITPGTRVMQNNGTITSNVLCFLSPSVTQAGQSYWGNAVTHSNAAAPPSSETTFSGFGNNYLIADSPVIHIETPCQITSVSYLTGPLPNNDPYQQHFICVGGTAAGQGATVVTSTPATAGSCPGGGVATAFTNTYSVGMYCVSTYTGSCTYGNLYAHITPLAYNIAIPATNTIVSFDIAEGPTLLPKGDYAVLMATNCDDGSVAGAGGVGASNGSGDLRCGVGLGEAGTAGSGGSANGGYQAATQAFAAKFFTHPTSRHARCLQYDVNHDNSTGLPPTLTSYDGGACTAVDGGAIVNVLNNEAPHILGFTWWSK